MNSKKSKDLCSHSTHRRGTDYCFTGLSVFSLGVHGQVYSGHCLHVPRVPGVPVSAGIRDGTTTGWRCGMAAGLQGTGLDEHLVPHLSTT